MNSNSCRDKRGPGILLTGATGFIGTAISQNLTQKEYCFLREVVRSRSSRLATNADLVLADMDQSPDWNSALQDINIVIHSAALAAIDSRLDLLSELKKINVDATLNLAQQAADSGVKRFIFLSSIKVNGETTVSGKSFESMDIPIPQDAYGISKMEAEHGLFEISQKTDMEVVCIRPPLVYGPRVKGNFLSLLRWLERGIPLPLGAIHNHRSLVGIDNLVDLIITCIDHPAAANQTFLVSDDEDLSTTELLQRMGATLNKPTRLLPVPLSLLELGARLLGKKGVAQRLLGNLQVDISKTKKLLGWSPPVSVDGGLRKTAEWYLKQR